MEILGVFLIFIPKNKLSQTKFLKLMIRIYCVYLKYEKFTFLFL